MFLPLFADEFSFFSPGDDDTTMSRKLAKFKDTFAYSAAKDSLASIKKEKMISPMENGHDSEKKKYQVLAHMKVDRYYSSVLESTARMSEDAMKLLEARDFISFFGTCGTTYVRSIRRLQEVISTFSFETCNPELGTTYYLCHIHKMCQYYCVTSLFKLLQFLT